MTGAWPAAIGGLLVMLAGEALFAGPPAAAQDGGRLFRQCQACHALEAGDNSPAGPTLHRIVGRPIAGEVRFNYSPALRRLAARDRRWTRARLDAFLANPDKMAPGTEMGFAGMANPEARRALIDWLAEQPTG